MNISSAMFATKIPDVVVFGVPLDLNIHLRFANLYHQYRYDGYEREPCVESSVVQIETSHLTGVR